MADMHEFLERSLSSRIRGTVDLGGCIYQYLEWNGETLEGRRIAFDTETTCLQADDPGIPDLALATAYDGDDWLH